MQYHRSDGEVAGAHHADNNSLLHRIKIGNPLSSNVKIRRGRELLADKPQAGKIWKGLQRSRAMHGQTMTEGTGMLLRMGFLKSKIYPSQIPIRRKYEMH